MCVLSVFFCELVCFRRFWILVCLCLFVHPPLLSICLSTERAVFSHWSFGRDLITYLFGLSYSKLLWLCVLLRTEIFPPFPPPVSIPSRLSLWPSPPHPPLTDIVAYAVCGLTLVFTQLFLCNLRTNSVLSYNCVLHHPFHFIHTKTK